MLLLGAVMALLIHVASMYLPHIRDVLGTQSVQATTWLVVAALAVTIVPALEIHKWSWRVRQK
jgi:hypothetical protein